MTQPPHIIRQWIEEVEDQGRGLSDWEKHFIESIADQFDLRGTITDKQEEVLEKIRAEKTS